MIDLSLVLLSIGALCLVTGFGIAWALTSWCALREHKY
jgi:hypothetical protein